MANMDINAIVESLKTTVKDLPVPVTVVAALGALSVLCFALQTVGVFYRFFLRGGKNLKKYGSYAVVTGATGTSPLYLQSHTIGNGRKRRLGLRPVPHLCADVAADGARRRHRQGLRLRVRAQGPERLPHLAHRVQAQGRAGRDPEGLPQGQGRHPR